MNNLDDLEKKANLISAYCRRLPRSLIVRSGGIDKIYFQSGSLKSDLDITKAYEFGNYLIIGGINKKETKLKQSTQYNIIDIIKCKKILSNRKILDIIGQDYDSIKGIGILCLHCAQSKILLNTDGQVFNLGKRLYQYVCPKITQETDQRGVLKVQLRVGLMNSPLGWIQVDFKQFSLPDYIFDK